MNNWVEFGRRAPKKSLFVHLCALMLLGAAASAADDISSEHTLQDFREVVKAAKDKVFPAVVYIKVMRKSLEAGKDVQQEVSGSGVIISAEGEVLTNWHVVDKAVSVRCLLSDGRPMNATVVGSDKNTDLGLLKLQLPPDVSTVPHAELGDSRQIAEGDFVMAMGAPWGLNRSVSIGIISCTRRFLPETSEYSLWLQTDAAISPGNSGGPLVNTEGKVIGLNTRGMMAGGDMGFAVPASTIEVLLPHFREHGEADWSWLGLQLQPLKDFDRNIYFAENDGVIIAETDPESPARRAGLEPRDRIVSVNGQPITAMTDEDLPVVRMRLALLPMHTNADFEIVRDGKPMKFTLEPRKKGKVEGEELDFPRWDFTAKAINQFDNPDLYFHRKEGVFIFGVKRPGNASTSGLFEQDIILKIDNQSVLTLEDVQRIHSETIANIAKKHKIVFQVLRDGLNRQVVLDFSRDHEKR